MECPRCKCKNITYKPCEKKNNVKRAMHMIGAGTLAIGGMVLLPIPGLHNAGLACMASSVAVGKTTPAKSTLRICKCQCHSCGHKWDVLL